MTHSRFLLAILCGVLFCALASAAAPVWAQDAEEETVVEETAVEETAEVWPAYPMPGPDKIDRGPGGYLSIFKIILVMLVFFAWVRSCDWVNRDAYNLRLSQAMWNPIVVFPFLFVLFFIFFSLPFFFLGFPLLLASYAGPFGAYVFKRNQEVSPEDQVFTGDHLKGVFAFKGGGKKRAGGGAARKGGGGGGGSVGPSHAAHMEGAQVDITAMGGADKNENQANLIKARNSAGYVPLKDLLADAIDRRATKILLDCTNEGTAVQYHLDGIWHPLDSYDRETGDPLLATAKKLCNLSIEERRARQDGRFAAAYGGQEFIGHLVTQGTKAGERAILQLLSQDVKYESLGELGMRDKVAEQLKELIAAQSGILLFSSVPGGGLSTTLTVALRGTDRFMRDFYELGDVDRMEPEVDGIELQTYQAKQGETPDALLPALMRKEPDVVVVRDMPNADTVKALSAASSEVLVISTVKAKEAVEALLRVLMLKAPPAPFAKAVRAVLCQRLIRKLCSECKEAYQPSAEMLAKLGIPAGRVKELYRPRQVPADQEVIQCPKCSGIGYWGQTAVFELLLVDDRLREILVKKPTIEGLRKAARAAGNRSLQEEGIVLVARGVTSLAELQRVLKQ